MQRSDHLKYRELLDAIKITKQEVYSVLLHAFQEGRQKDLASYPYEFEKGLIFQALWRYLDTLPLDKYQQPYADFKAAVPIEEFIKQHLSEKSGRLDISDNKKQMLDEATKLFYEIQNLYIVAKQQTKFLIASQVQDEAIAIQRECLEASKKLNEYQQSLNDYAEHQSALVTYKDVYAGVVQIARLLNKTNISPDMLAYERYISTSDIFRRMRSLLTKIQRGVVSAALIRFDAEMGQEQEESYKRELKAFSKKLSEENQRLIDIIDRFSQRYDNFKLELMQYDHRLQRLANQESDIQASLQLIDQLKKQSISSEIISVCERQSAYPRMMSNSIALFSGKEGCWYAAGQKIHEILSGLTRVVTAYTASFSEDYVTMSVEAMQEEKLRFSQQYVELRLIDPILILWQQCTQYISQQAQVVKQKASTSSGCCFLSQLLSIFRRPEPQPGRVGNALDLHIQEDIDQESVALLAEMRAYEEADYSP